MSFAEFIDYIKINFSFKNHAEIEPVKLIQALFLFFRNALNKVNESGLQLSFNVLLNPLTCHAKKKKLYSTQDY